MASSSKLEQLIKPVVEAQGAFLVDVTVGNDRRVKILEIFIDTETGVTAELCAAISREVAPILDESSDFSGPYNIVVSSPGLDRPLKLPQQYRRNLGRNVSVAYETATGKQKVSGELIEVQPNFISIRPADADDPLQIPFEGIKETLVIPRW